MAAGNLGTTQAVLNRIRRNLASGAADQDGVGQSRAAAADDQRRQPDLCSARYLFEVADSIGQLSMTVQRQFAPSLREAGATGEASFILGGQIAGKPHGLYLVYPQGNAVMATPETCLMRIGESKYG